MDVLIYRFSYSVLLLRLFCIWLLSGVVVC